MLNNSFFSRILYGYKGPSMENNLHLNRLFKIISKQKKKGEKSYSNLILI